MKARLPHLVRTALLNGVAAAILLALPAMAQAETFTLSEATIAEAEAAMQAGALSSVELTVLYLNRLAHYDANGLELNAVPVRNPDVLADAQAADAARAAGKSGALLGIPFTVKDSYKVRGLTVASGSPALASLVANEDAFTVGRIRDAGGVLLGKTNMPPIAEGGMQEGIYGRAESPYNPAYLAAAFQSGSSNGSAVSTAASMAMFGMGEETVSSGRSPASNNGLVAYTPSRGLLSIRGNWPLYPLRDVVVPHTRTVEDMLALLNVIMTEDEIKEGDLWREQTAVALPAISSVRPEDFTSLAQPGALAGLRIGVPKMYIGKDTENDTPIETRASVIALWERAAKDLEALGAEIVEVDFPVMANQPGFAAPAEYVPEAFNEFAGISWYAERFLKQNNDPNYPSFANVDPALIFPRELGSPLMTSDGASTEWYVSRFKDIATLPAPWESPHWDEALNGYERWRQVEFEDWMDENELDLIVFPANGDIGEATANRDPIAFEHAMKPGTFFSNMDGTMRLLGIPSVSVTMGLLEDIRMPVNLTFAGKAYSDSDLLRYAFDYEQASQRREAPAVILPLDGEVIDYDPSSAVAPADRSETVVPSITLAVSSSAPLRLSIDGSASDESGLAAVRLYVNGQLVEIEDMGTWSANVELPYFTKHVTVIAIAKDQLGNTSAQMQNFTVDHDGTVTPRDPKSPVLL